MRKLTAIAIALVGVMLFGCAEREPRQISMEEIAEVYESAGYTVSCKQYDQPMEDGATGYLQADAADGEYIYFRFFENEAAAQIYEDEMDHPGILYGFSVLFGDPTWQTVKTYGNISITYFDSEDYGPFEKILDKS